MCKYTPVGTFDVWLHHSIYICVCISYNTGKSALPDIYARCQRMRRAQGQVRIYQAKHETCVITNMLHF